MKEYIERESARDLMEQALVDEWEIQYADDRLDEIPAADVVEVRHGRWIPVTNGRGGSECNQCHAYAPSYQSGAEYNSPYCPNCGAKIDRGADDEPLHP